MRWEIPCSSWAQNSSLPPSKVSLHWRRGICLPSRDSSGQAEEERMNVATTRATWNLCDCWPLVSLQVKNRILYNQGGVNSSSSSGGGDDDDDDYDDCGCERKSFSRSTGVSPRLRRSWQQYWGRSTDCSIDIIKQSIKFFFSRSSHRFARSLTCKHMSRREFHVLVVVGVVVARYFPSQLSKVQPKDYCMSIRLVGCHLPSVGVATAATAVKATTRLTPPVASFECDNNDEIFST